MRKDIKRVARQTINRCSGSNEVMVKSGNVDDIIEVILHADEVSKGATKRFVKHLRASSDLATLKNVYKFVRDNIRYVRDADAEEVIKTPGCTLAEGAADCKSMTIMTGSLLRDLGFTFSYRVAFYDPMEPQQGHIYTVAKLNGETVIVDPVHDKFNKEITPWKFKDYKPAGAPSIGRISKPGNANTFIPALPPVTAPGWGMIAPFIAVAALMYFHD